MANETSTVKMVTTSLIAYLRDNNCAAELVAPGVSMATVELAAAAVGVDPERILKSLLFADGSGSVVLAIASGLGKINRTRLAEVAQTGRLKLADATTVQRVTGFPVGGVSPVGHAERIPVIIDRRVMTLTDTYGGGGSEDVLLRITPAEIQRLTGGVIAEIVDPVEMEP